MPKLNFRKKEEVKEKKTQLEEINKLFEEQEKIIHIQRASGVHFAEIPPSYNIVEVYPLNPPWAYAKIGFNPADGSYKYFVDEVKLSPIERKLLNILMNILIYELELPSPGVSTIDFFRKKAREIIRKYMIRLGRTPGISWAKLMYYIEREVVGFGEIDAIMRDPYVEDISCDGIGKPVYVWHRKYESIPTNLTFNDEDFLDAFLIKLAHMAGTHVSVAFPIVDAILPGGHRLAGTFRKEVTTKGTTFTIRKFREDPITLVDMIGWRNMSLDIASYLWLMMEHKMTGLILGVTGSGKTTALNAIASLIKPDMKVVTIEDTPELRLPLENWVQLVTRQSYGIGTEKIGEITLFDLIKVSLRYRPDYIIVGEVRGEEAYALMQAVATGHGGLTTLHAENVTQAINRLTSEPMNTPKSFIPFINFVAVVKRLSIINPDGSRSVVRRVTDLNEVIDYGEYIQIASWNPADDTHTFELKRSVMVRKIAEMRGKDFSWVENEIENRKTILEYLLRTGKRYYLDIASTVRRYYQKPEETVMEIRNELERLKRGGT